MIASKNLILSCAYMWVAAVWVIGAEEEIGSPLRIAQCRARCISKFSKEPESQEKCFQETDCFMCWENCQLLQANFPIWGGICSESGICFPGCQEACHFHREMSPLQQKVPVIQTRGEEVIFVKNHTAFWPRPSRPGHSVLDPLVYVVMRRLPGRMWRQIIQTLETTSRVPDDLSSGALLRVLVVDSDGLFTIYSPVASESSLRSANDIARSSGQSNLNKLFAAATTTSFNNSNESRPMAEAEPARRRINTEIARKRTDLNDSTEVTEYTMWNLREISLIHQKVLVIAEIAWDAVPAYVMQRPLYLVTWEVDGGGLKGNLFTDSTCVTLSLWPDTVYHIQVELVGHSVATGRPQQSEDFLLDTHRAVAVELETSSPNLNGLTATPDVTAFRHRTQSNDVSAEFQQLHGPAVIPHKIDMLAEKKQLEIFFAVGAAFAVFLLVLVVLVYASCRHSDVLSYPKANMDIFSLKPGKKSDVDCSRFPREFVPILMLVSENFSKKRPSTSEVTAVEASLPSLKSRPQFLAAEVSHLHSSTCSLISEESSSSQQSSLASPPLQTHFCDSSKTGYSDQSCTS